MKVIKKYSVGTTFDSETFEPLIELKLIFPLHPVSKYSNDKDFLNNLIKDVLEDVEEILNAESQNNSK